MTIIKTGRNKGKTTKLVKLALETGAYLVVLNQDEISRIRRTFDKVPKMISFDEFRNSRYFAKGISNFVIDNAELLLQSMTPVTIIGISLTD